MQDFVCIFYSWLYNCAFQSYMHCSDVFCHICIVVTYFVIYALQWRILSYMHCSDVFCHICIAVPYFSHNCILMTYSSHLWILVPYFASNVYPLISSVAAYLLCFFFEGRRFWQWISLSLHHTGQGIYKFEFIIYSVAIFMCLIS